MPPKLRSAADLLASAVGEAIEALDLPDEDAGVARLARAYAAEIDARNPEESVEVLGNLGPKLLATLDALGATPKARGSAPRNTPTVGGKLAGLRAARSS